MGYCYDNRRRLCCDACGRAGDVRKMTCPFQYCPAPALCLACGVERAATLSQAAHRQRGCESGRAALLERESQRQALLKAGEPVRCSALRVDGPEGHRVHVLFQATAGTVGFFMSRDTYDVVPLLETATPERFRSFGPIEPAPSSFYSTEARHA